MNHSSTKFKSLTHFISLMCLSGAATANPDVGASPKFKSAVATITSIAQPSPDIEVLKQMIAVWPDNSSVEAEELLAAAARSISAGNTNDLPIVIRKLSAELRPLIKSGTDTHRLATSCSALGKKLLRSYYLSESAEFLELAQAASKADDVLHLQATSDLGVVREFQGQYQQALQNYHQILNHGKQNARAYASACLNLGRLCRKLDRQKESRDFYTKALNRSKHDTRLRAEYARSLNGLGMWHLTTGNVAAAKDHLSRALPLLTDPRERATCARNLGLVALEDEDLDTATKNFVTSLNLLGANGQALTPEYATSQLMLANTLIKRKELKKAEDLIEQYGQMIQKRFGKTHPRYGFYLSNYAHVARQAGRIPESRRAYEDSLRIHEEHLGKGHIESVGIKINLAGLYLAEQNVKAAVEVCLDAMATISQHLDEMSLVQDEVQQARLSLRYRDALGVLISAASRDRSILPRIYEQVLTFKARPLRRALLTNVMRDNPRLGQVIRERRRLMTQISRYALAGSVTTPSERQDRRNDLLKRQRELREEVNAFVYQSIHSVKSSTAFKDLCDTFRDNEAMLDFLIAKPSDDTKPHLFVFMVKKDQLALADLGLANDVTSNIDLWLSAVDLGDSKKLEKVASELREQIWANDNNTLSAEKFCHGLSTIVICPDGHLFKFPLEALPAKSRNQYLIDQCSFTVCPFPSSIASRRRNRRRVTNATMLVIGEIDYGHNAKDPEHDLGPLKTTRETTAAVDALSSMFPDGEVKQFRGSAATEEAFTANSSTAHWIHIATHATQKLSERFQVSKRGMTLFELPWMNCGIAFAGANNEQGETSDGFLTGAEAALLQLPNNTTVVLSACETGVGEIIESDGVFGLQRAFHISGAERVVASLWAVNDAATAALMQEFYKNLAENRSIPESLRLAKIAVRDGFDPAKGTVDRGIAGTRKARRASPRLWAAFSVSGDWH